MRDERVTDEWLYKYMPIVDEAMLRELESRADDTFDPSDSLDLRMEELLNEESSRPGVRAGFMKKVSVIAACILCVLLLAVTGEKASPAVETGKTEEDMGEHAESIYSGCYINPAGFLCTINATASGENVEGTVTVYDADGNLIASDIIYVTEGAILVDGDGTIYQQFGMANGILRTELVFDENGSYSFNDAFFRK